MYSIKHFPIAKDRLGNFSLLPAKDNKDCENLEYIKNLKIFIYLILYKKTSQIILYLVALFRPILSPFYHFISIAGGFCASLITSA